ncbi:atherin-like [Marmota marmota marmota]|uniref:atherin-like n=1 Tax=Marmota marmota marmota TaxID=9994 RepID=UPI002093A6BF|nr:atherin-like [Marmota marmota marmota]
MAGGRYKGGTATSLVETALLRSATQLACSQAWRGPSWEPRDVAGAGGSGAVVPFPPLPPGHPSHSAVLGGGCSTPCSYHRRKGRSRGRSPHHAEASQRRPPGPGRTPVSPRQPGTLWDPGSDQGFAVFLLSSQIPHPLRDPQPQCPQVLSVHKPPPHAGSRSAGAPPTGSASHGGGGVAGSFLSQARLPSHTGPGLAPRHLLHHWPLSRAVPRLSTGPRSRLLGCSPPKALAHLWLVSRTGEEGQAPCLAPVFGGSPQCSPFRSLLAWGSVQVAVAEHFVDDTRSPVSEPCGGCSVTLTCHCSHLSPPSSPVQLRLCQWPTLLPGSACRLAPLHASRLGWLGR